MFVTHENFKFIHKRLDIILVLQFFLALKLKNEINHSLNIHLGHENFKLSFVFENTGYDFYLFILKKIKPI